MNLFAKVLRMRMQVRMYLHGKADQVAQSIRPRIQRASGSTQMSSLTSRYALCAAHCGGLVYGAEE